VVFKGATVWLFGVISGLSLTTVESFAYLVSLISKFLF
jgi:hypothetical protein